MASGTFDANFEKFIIFHRGISEVSMKEDKHLHVIYQDGYDQDLGDPYGDETRENLQKTIAAKESTEQTKADTDALYEAIKQKGSEASTAFTNATNAANTAREAQNAAEEKWDEVTELERNILAAIGAVNGIEYEEGGRGYYVDFGVAENSFNETLQDIYGLAYDSEEEKYSVDYTDANRYTDDKIGQVMDDTTGVEYDEVEKHYYIAFNDEWLATESEVNALFD